MCLQSQRLTFHVWVGKIPWRREWQHTPVFLLENSMDRGAWRATVHEVTNSQTWLSNSQFHLGKCSSTALQLAYRAHSHLWNFETWRFVWLTVLLRVADSLFPTTLVKWRVYLEQDTAENGGGLTPLSHIWLNSPWNNLCPRALLKTIEQPASNDSQREPHKAIVIWGGLWAYPVLYPVRINISVFVLWKEMYFT